MLRLEVVVSTLDDPMVWARGLDTVVPEQLPEELDWAPPGGEVKTGLPVVPGYWIVGSLFLPVPHKPVLSGSNLPSWNWRR